MQSIPEETPPYRKMQSLQRLRGLIRQCWRVRAVGLLGAPPVGHKNGRQLLCVGISALVTLGLRAAPFLLGRGGKGLPEWVRRLGKLLPPAIMAVLVVYCLKDGITTPAENAGPLLLGSLLTVGSYAWKRSTLLSILLGTGAYMLALRLL